VEDVLLNRRPDATERLVTFRRVHQETRARSAPAAEEEPGARSPWRRAFSHALVKGILGPHRRGRGGGAAEVPQAPEVIEGPLMAGMT